MFSYTGVFCCCRNGRAIETTSVDLAKRSLKTQEQFEVNGLDVDQQKSLLWTYSSISNTPKENNFYMT